MSTGGLRDLLRASPEKFNRMIKDVPTSDKKMVLNFFQNRLKLLEGHSL